MILLALSLACFSFGFVLIAVLTLLRRRDSTAVKFAIFSFFVAGWGIPQSIWMTETFDLATTYQLSRASHVFAAFIPIAWMHFVFSLIKKREPFKHFYLAAYILSGFIGLAAMVQDILLAVPHAVGEFKYFSAAGQYYTIFTVYFFTFVPYTYFYLIKAWLQSKGQLRRQMWCFVLATSFGFAGGSCTFVPVYGVAFPLTAMYLMPLYPLFMGIGLIRYGLFDIEQITQALRKERLAALGMLTASVNHEIRSPLYIVQGMCENYLARIDEPGRPANETNTVHKILEQVTRTSKIITKYSSMAKQNTRDAPNKKNVSVKRVLHEIDPLIGPTLEENEIELDVAIEADQIFIDQSDLEEILLNLIQNACQAMAEKKGQIEILCKEEQASISLGVRDNGPGLSEREKSQIFEPFFSTKNEGSGLGLYIVKQLVERNGGKIKVESTPAKGTRFEMEFPA